MYLFHSVKESKFPLKETFRDNFSVMRSVKNDRILIHLKYFNSKTLKNTILFYKTINFFFTGYDMK